MTALQLALWLIAAALPPSEATDSTLSRHEFRRIRMGVPFTITLYASSDQTAKAAANAAFARIKELDRVMSDYDPDSELMRLCVKAESGKPVPISKDLWIVLQHSQQLSRETDGAFDVTVGPVVKLWRRARRKKQLPPDKQLAAALTLVGHQHIRVDAKQSTVRLLKPGMRLDLGAIAKGYAADEALAVLRKHGVTRALVDASGDIVAGDPPPGKPAWRIGIAPIKTPDGKPTRYLSLKNAAVATSGDAVQYVEIAGTRYSHIIDPHTGLGLTQRSSVTVIAPTGMIADSLASALSVLPPNIGLHLLKKRKQTEALIVRLKNGEPEEFTSAGWK